MVTLSIPPHMPPEGHALPGPRVVGIGASAGGLHAFTNFVDHMPPDSGLAFVLVQHLDPVQPSLLHEILAEHTSMSVSPVIDLTPVAPNHIYIIPPNTTLTISQGVLRLTPPTEAHGHRLPINNFFRSLAADQGSRAVGILLSGTGADGTLGLVEIKARGGMTLAQTPETAAYPAMPQHAITQGAVDHTLDIAAMPTLLLATAGLPPKPAGQPIRAPAESLRVSVAPQQGAGRDIGHLTAANQELRSLNEELQVANEEFQTSKEEIQSINAELQTVNAELSRKIAELDRANADLANLFASTQLPAIFLHIDGRIARFTAQATELFALIESDIGRPITDLNAHFIDNDLRPLMDQVLKTHTAVELVVHRPDRNRWWSVHIMPYRTLTNEIDGIVLTFDDITTLKRAEAVLQEAHDELERRVEARTQDLAQTNTALQAQIVERARSEQAREQLLQQLVTAQEEERRHIARELHDQMGQDITALILGLKVLQGNSAIGDSTAERIAQLQAMAVQIGNEVRSLAVQLRPSVLDDLGLALALNNYVEQWSARAHVAVDLHSSGLDGKRLPLAVETTIYRLVQESLNNVLKHARAAEVSVIIERHADEVRLIVEDDGAGFNVPPLPTPPTPVIKPDVVPQLGLIGMQERVVLLGGSLAIESAPGSGTTIFARIPLPGV